MYMASLYLLYHYYYIIITKKETSFTYCIGYQEVDGAKFFAFELVVKVCKLTQSYLYSCVELIATSQGLKSQKSKASRKK